jgi:hypothetical protein
MKQELTIEILIREAKTFCEKESKFDNPDLFGITDGKAVGTFIEHKFQDYLSSKYDYIIGSSASGIDMPSEDINTDIKVTSAKQPQSSCPFRNARQKKYMAWGITCYCLFMRKPMIQIKRYQGLIL